MLQESLSALKEILHKIDPAAYEAALENPEQKKSDKYYMLFYSYIGTSGLLNRLKKELS